MATSLNLDPLEMWRQTVSRLEEGMNAMGTRSLKADEISKALVQFSTVSMQLRHVMDKALGKYFKSVNLASRKEVVELAETLRRIEDKLDRLLPDAEQQPAPRPVRTRQPRTVAAALDTSPEIAPHVPGKASKPRRAAGVKRARKAA